MKEAETNDIHRHPWFRKTECDGFQFDLKSIFIIWNYRTTFRQLFNVTGQAEQDVEEVLDGRS